MDSTLIRRLEELDRRLNHQDERIKALEDVNDKLTQRVERLEGKKRV